MAVLSADEERELFGLIARGFTVNQCAALLRKRYATIADAVAWLTEAAA